MAIGFATTGIDYFETRADGGFAWNVAYDLTGRAARVTVSLRIDFVGADPGATAAIWEAGAESLWNRQFLFSDGTRLAELVLDVVLVDGDAHQTVTVHAGAGRADMLNWYLLPEGWGTDFHDEIAAHEVGHMLGAFDEYPGGATLDGLLAPGNLMSDLSHVVLDRHVAGLEWATENAGGLALDTVAAQRGDDGTDSFDGTAGMDGFYGGKGNDTLNGQGGNDFLVGDAGRDRIMGGSGADYGRGGTDRDMLSGAQGNDTLDGGSGADVLDGGDNADRLLGGGDGDLIRGGNGNDWLIGGAGNDTLYGGHGIDRLVGGDGGDAFHFAQGETPRGDIIVDFVSGTDTIQFVAATGDGLGPTALRARQFLTGADVTAAATPDHRFVFDTTTGSLYFDADGAGGVDAIRFARLSAAVLAAADIVWDFA